jgi:hypothetical protein
MLGDAATLMPASAALYTLMNPSGKRVTVEAALEGRSGDFYGGWGFYFVSQASMARPSLMLISVETVVNIQVKSGAPLILMGSHVMFPM